MVMAAIRPSVRDVSELLEICAEDWSMDSFDGHYLDKKEVCAALLQVADIWTRTTAPNEYLRFLASVRAKVFVLAYASTPSRISKTDKVDAVALQEAKEERMSRAAEFGSIDLRSVPDASNLSSESADVAALYRAQSGTPAMVTVPDNHSVSFARCCVFGPERECEGAIVSLPPPLYQNHTTLHLTRTYMEIWTLFR